MSVDSSIRCASRSLAAFVLIAALSATLCLAQISFVSQVNPFPDQDFYADIWGEGDFAYLASWGPSGATGVLIYDVSDPANPVLATPYNGGPGGLPYQDVKVADGIGYFGLDDGSTDGTDIVDLSDPTNPVLLLRLNEADDNSLPNVHNVSVHAGFLYQADSESATVAVFDVSTPAAAFFVRDIDTPGVSIHDITARGGRLFAADIGGAETYIYDVTNVGVAAPPLLGTIPSVPASHSSWVSDDGTILVNVEERDAGDVTLWDITDPANPVLLSTINAVLLGIDASLPHNPILVGDILYMSWYESGLQVLDISDPSNPVHLGGFDTFPGPNEGDQEGNWGVYPLLGPDRVLLSDSAEGMIIVDVTSIVTPPLFANGFEEGNISAWESSAP
jgi:choice-of-anchor B domain-containing protein